MKYVGQRLDLVRNIKNKAVPSEKRAATLASAGEVLISNHKIIIHHQISKENNPVSDDSFIVWFRLFWKIYSPSAFRGFHRVLIRRT